MEKILRMVFYFLVLTIPYTLYPIPCCFAAGFDKNSAGTASVQSLKIAVDARGVALGEAFSALADGASALDWNPAGLIKIKKQSLSFMHSPYLAGTYMDFFAYAQNAGAVGSWGVAFKYMNYGSIKKTDSSGVASGGFTPYDMVANVGFATYITGFNKEPEERFVLGATGKLVRSQILLADNTVSADIGILFPYFFDNRFQLAMTAQNIMGTLRYDREEYPLPLILRLGSATKINNYFILTADLVAARDNYPFLAMGGEFKISVRKTALFLRGGFNTRAVTDISGFRNLTFGTGFKYGTYSIDYSLSPFGSLGSVHRISAGLNF
ncbi:MAG: PorV/PorQ family protein [Elusimicrobia bacterium]|nr:PorV/PorQ family protein [Elusimicrobiota bacterium]